MHFRRHLVCAAAVAFSAAPWIGEARQAPAPPAPPTSAPAASAGTQRPRPAPPRESLRAVRERGTLRACVTATEPWLIQGPEGQPAQGFGVDVARQLAEDLGVDLQVVPTTPSDVMGELVEGACDVIPAGLAATPDRALFLHFTTPIADHDVEAIAPAGTIGSLADLDAPGTAVGAVEGSAELQDARRKLPRADIRTFESQSALGEALRARTVRAVVVASPFSDIAARLTNSAVAVVGTPLARRRESMAVRRGDLEFLAYLDTWIQARTDDGWLADRARHWFEDLGWMSQPQ